MAYNHTNSNIEKGVFKKKLNYNDQQRRNNLDQQLEVEHLGTKKRKNHENHHDRFLNIHTFILSQKKYSYIININLKHKPTL